MLTTTTEKLLHNARRLREKKFFHQPADMISVLLPGKASLLLLTPDQVPAQYSFADIAAGVLPEQQLDQARLHAQIYQQREDVGAIASLSPHWCGALSKLAEVMPSVFDEHARHIGRSWRLSNAEQIAAAISAGGNCGTIGEQLLAMGVTQNRMVFNAELFEKCAMAYTLARTSGQPVKTIPWWVRLIAGKRLKKDQHQAVVRHQAGLEAEELKAY